MAYIGKQPTVGNFVKLDTITTSATTTFNLLSGGVAYSPQSANHCIVSLNGVIQSPNTSFTISGSTIVFASALTSSDVIDFILVLGDVLNIGTPSDATVGFSKITSNLITGATAETSIAGGDSILIYDDSATALRKMTRTNFVAGLSVANTPAFSATMTASQTFTDVVYAKVQYNSETFDTDNAYDPTTNYRFTVPSGKDGKYFFNVITFLGTNTNTTTYSYDLELRKNNVQVAVENLYNVNENGFGKVCGLSAILDLVATDYVEVWLIQNTANGSTTNVVSGSAFNRFEGFKLI